MRPRVPEQGRLAGPGAPWGGFVLEEPWGASQAAGICPDRLTSGAAPKG